jgi:hypothetical protein
MTKSSEISSNRENNPDPYWTGNQEKVIDLQRKRAFKESLGNGPWESVEEKDEFRKALIEFAKASGKRSPGGFTKSILDEMAKEGYEHPYWLEWKEGRQIGEHEKQEWEALPGQPYPYFLKYLQTELKRQDYTDAQATEQANWICQNPQRAKPHWENFKNRIQREAEEKERSEKQGCISYVPPKYLRDTEITTEDAIASIQQIKGEEQPMLEKPNYQDALKPRQQEIEAPSYPDNEKSGHQEVEVSGHQDTSQSGTSEEEEPEIDPVAVVSREVNKPEKVLKKSWQSGFGSFLKEKLAEAIAKGTPDEQAQCWRMLLENPVTKAWASQQLEEDYDF